MTEALKVRSRHNAEKYYRSGFNCAESVARGMDEVLALNLNPETFRMFTGYGGGFGHAGCICGALNAAVAILGFLTGRSSVEEDRSVAYKLAHKFHDRFEDELDGTCCRVLNPNPFGSKEQRVNCLRITGTTAEILAEFLEEEKLLS